MPGLTTVWFSEPVIQVLLEESEGKLPAETGGLLMGYWADDGQQSVVTTTVGPGPRALHHRHRFVPDYEYQEEALARIYNQSGGATSYLGDWHSHGKALPWLSRKDKYALYAIAAEPMSRAPRAIMAIVGGFPDWSVRTWEYSAKPLPRLTYCWSYAPCRIRTWLPTEKKHAFDHKDSKL